MADFEGVGFLQLDELLSEEERLAQDTVRDFVSKEFLPRIQEHVRQGGSFPMELVPSYEGTHDVHTLILGEAITGMRAI